MFAINLFDYMPQAIANPWLFLTVGSLSAFIFGLGKVGFGGAVGILSVPLMIYACDGHSQLATGLMLPLLITADYGGVMVWRGRWDRRCALGLLPGAAIGILTAAVIMYYAGAGDNRQQLDNYLKLAIGIISSVFVLIALIQGISGKKWTFRPRPTHAAVAGSLLGFTSTLAHAAGPVAGMYLLSQDMPRDKYAATSNLLFWSVNQMKLPAYIYLHLIDKTSLLAGLWLVPAALIGASLGKRLNTTIPQKTFNIIVYSLLGVMGVHMVMKAIPQIF